MEICEGFSRHVLVSNRIRVFVTSPANFQAIIYLLEVNSAKVKNGEGAD